MSTIKENLAAFSDVNITLASLTNGSSRQSDEVDNSTNLYVDALVTLKYKTGSGTVGNGRLLVYAFSRINGTPDRTDNAGASDAAFTTANIKNMRLLATLNADTASTQYYSAEYSVANVFGGRLPQYWGIVVDNDEGQTLDSTAGNFKLSYQGVKYDVA